MQQNVIEHKCKRLKSYRKLLMKPLVARAFGKRIDVDCID